MRNLVILRLCGYNKTVSDSVWKGCVAMYQQIAEYFQTSSERWFSMLAGHIGLSAGALLPAIVIAVPAGFLCVRYARLNRPVTALFGTLRIIPSLAVLLLMLPVLGTGALPAMAALVLLAIPPILANTIAGLNGVPDFMLETAVSLGMTQEQVWWKVRFPLALPLIFAGVKTAAVEIIASATLAARIGAGGLGDLIFTGIGLFRTDLLLIGGGSVAVLSLLAGLLFGLLEKMCIRYKTI